MAAWVTSDPLWPDESAFNYVAANPTNYSDPTGLQAGPLPTCLMCAKDTVGPADEAANRFCKENGIGAPSNNSSVCNAALHVGLPHRSEVPPDWFLVVGMLKLRYRQSQGGWRMSALSH